MPDPSTLMSRSNLPANSDQLESGDLQGSLAILRGLFTGDHLNASGGRHYSNKNFGRDSAISMLFLLDEFSHTVDAETRRETRFVIEKGIHSLVHWQGGKDPKVGERWRKNSEERGKIHHEAGPVNIDEKGLVKRWQDGDDSQSDMLVYFGSVDSTPLYIKLVCAYVAQLKKIDPSGHEAYTFLLSKVPNFRGGETSVAESLMAAVGWIERSLASSDLGFIEYSRKPGQEEGIPNQVWKDSLTSYVHLDGELANTKAPIASIEVQALTYDALASLAELFKNDQILASSLKLNAGQTDQWQGSAKELQQRILDKFWIAEKLRFAQAIDREPRQGRPRQVATPSSNELHLLNSRLFDDLGDAQSRQYIDSLVRQATSEEFLTDVGIRCRGRSYHNLINFTDYHGSWAVWPWESHWIAMGLRYQGLAELADQIDIRVMNSFIISSEYAEFYLVNPISGKCYYRFVEMGRTLDADAGHEEVVATNIPDTPQTWSATAAIDIRAIFSGPEKIKARSLWLKGLEQDILSYISKSHLLKPDQDLQYLRKNAAVAVVDLAGGQHADNHYYTAVGDKSLTPAFAN